MAVTRQARARPARSAQSSRQNTPVERAETTTPVDSRHGSLPLSPSVRALTGASSSRNVRRRLSRDKEVEGGARGHAERDAEGEAERDASGNAEGEAEGIAKGVAEDDAEYVMERVAAGGSKGAAQGDAEDSSRNQAVVGAKGAVANEVVDKAAASDAMTDEPPTRTQNAAMGGASQAKAEGNPGPTVGGGTVTRSKSLATNDAVSRAKSRAASGSASPIESGSEWEGGVVERSGRRQARKRSTPAMTEGSAVRPRKSRRVMKRRIEVSDEDSDGVEEYMDGDHDEHVLLPNDLLLQGGNATAFKYQLLSGDTLALNYLDVYYSSLKRFLNDNTINLASDIILRKNRCTPSEGWVWMHETNMVLRVVGQQPVDGNALSFERMLTILKSKVLLVPIHTARSMHWSLLVIANLKSILSAALNVKNPNKGVFPPAKIPEGQPKPVAIHFDSMKSSSGHKSSLMHFRTFIYSGLESVWKQHHMRRFAMRRISPKFRPFVARSLPFLDANMQQQGSDEVTCGWRAVDAVRFVAENRPSDLDWGSLAEREMDIRFKEIAKRTLSFIQKKMALPMSDIPSLFYPVHDVMDSVCCSQFSCDLVDLNKTLATFFKSQKRSGNNERANEKKRQQARKFDEVYEAVATEMCEQGINVRRKLRKAVKMKTHHCKAIARYIFHYPRGTQYASCIYYTRYNYPDSMLACTGVNIMLQKSPRFAGQSLSSAAARVPKSSRVHYQMAVFLDWTRSKARNWDTVARFRLQELSIHFIGIGEAILRSCCRQAQYNEDNQATSGLEQLREPAIESDMLSEDGVDEGWSFARSITIEEGDTENGTIRCSVSHGDIGSALINCLTAAEQVGNEAILECTADFENHCKRVLQLCSPRVKLSEVEFLVTGSSMAKIHSTFIDRYRTALVDRIKSMWGHLLSNEFIQTSVRPLLTRMITAADSFYSRNGELFLGISTAPDPLLSQPVKKRTSKSHEKPQANRERNAPSSTTREDKSVAIVERSVFVAKSFGLGANVSFLNNYTRSPLNEFLSMFFYILQGCRSHETSERFHCGDLGRQKWGTDLAECQRMLQEVWKSFEANAKKAKGDYDETAVSGDEDSFERLVASLKFDVVVRAASKIADTTNKHSQVRSTLCRSGVFCYEVPTSYRFASKVKTGRRFDYQCQGQEDTVLWHGLVTGVVCKSLTQQEAGISISEQYAMISDFPIDARDAPKLHRMNLEVRIACDFDFWSGAKEVECRDSSFVGFRKHECVLVVFAFHNGSDSYVFPHPVTGNYTHSFLGVVVSPCTGTGGDTKGRNPKFVGPRNFSVEVMVHDDVSQASGCPCSIQDLVERFKGSGGFTGCYLMPLDDLSLNEDVWQYNGLCLAPKLPIPFRLVFFNASLADAYHQEQRKVHYDALRAIRCSRRAELLSFPSQATLEDSDAQMVANAALSCDTRLNKEQLQVIQSVLYGWQTKEAPNNALTMRMHRSEVLEHIRTLDTVPKASLKWWGSHSCFVQGPPGTGKTRMLAALISVVLQNMEDDLRILVGCETNKALDDIFVAVLRNFRGKGSYRRVHQSLVRIGNSKINVVRERCIKNLPPVQAKDAVENAKVVFTTFGSAYRSELCLSTRPFSIILFEESCLMKEAMAFHALAIGLHSGPEPDTGGSKKVVFVCIGDPRQLHERDFTLIPVSRTVEPHFFDRIFDKKLILKGDTRLILKRQYRMNPSLASFVSNQFYDGELITETAGELPWKENALFNGLRDHDRFPLRNVTVVDTSLEGKTARETLGTSRSFYNMFEIKVIVHVLKAWCTDIDRTELCKKVTIITTYARQRDELIQRLREENLPFPVHTVDELQGGENDIVIVLLVRARSTAADDLDGCSAGGSGIGFVSSDERINVAISRARQCCMVIGFADHIARNCTSWRNFFAECAEKSGAQENDETHGYYRLRYVKFEKDLRFATFTPTYIR